MNDLLILVIGLLVAGTAAQAAYVTLSRPTLDSSDGWN